MISPEDIAAALAAAPGAGMAPAPREKGTLLSLTAGLRAGRGRAGGRTLN